MSYLIGQILFCLLVAAVLGAFVGWLAKELSGRRAALASEERWRKRVRQATQQTGAIKNQLIEAKQIEDDLRTELRRLRDATLGDAAPLTDDPSQVAELRSELVQRDKKIELLEIQVSQSAAALTSEWESLNGLKAELAERQQRLDELGKQQQSDWSKRLKESQDLRRKLRQQVSELEEKVARRDKELHSARRELTAARETNADINWLAGELESRDQQIAELGEALARAQESSSMPASDDLTRIRGIGPVLQRKLNGLGVTTFAQIASWSEDDVDRVGAELGAFSGRIRRDGWIESAAALANSPEER